MIDEFHDDPLAVRLRRIALPEIRTDHGTVVARGGRRPGRRAGRRIAIGLVTAAVAIAAILGTSYLAPAFGSALAQGPAGSQIERILQAFHVAAGGTEIEPWRDTSTSGQHTLQLVGGLAEPGRTVLVLWSDSITVTTGTLTDQLGHRYEPLGGVSNAVNGYSVLEFAAFPWLESKVGARLEFTTQTAKSRTKPYGAVRGDWVLHTIAFAAASVRVAHSQTMTIGPITAELTSVQRTGHTLSLRMVLRGGGVWQEIPADAKGGSGEQLLTLEQDGQTLAMAVESMTGDATVQVDAVWIGVRADVPATLRLRLRSGEATTTLLTGPDR